MAAKFDAVELTLRQRSTQMIHLASRIRRVHVYGGSGAVWQLGADSDSAPAFMSEVPGHLEGTVLDHEITINPRTRLRHRRYTRTVTSGWVLENNTGPSRSRRSIQ
ncbi:hypothetical protein PISMIDRAFT_18616 [Pisolithus microcarpus 441]|uniref:Uncharacterized protein n=1 Tax=Pisolithus microcarpus 441 TaxID=765257 RepID=A0A0C9YXI0_9AGAM|nr:hypothetical protein PISMIDRAFT_18616 [Pisolithus microcarpus 441]